MAKTPKTDADYAAEYDALMAPQRDPEIHAIRMVVTDLVALIHVLEPRQVEALLRWRQGLAQAMAAEPLPPEEEYRREAHRTAVEILETILRTEPRRG